MANEQTMPPDGSDVNKKANVQYNDIMHDSDEGDSGDAYVAPDGGWAWMVMLANWYLNIIVCGVDLSATMFYQAMLREYKQTRTATAYVFSIHLIVRYMISPVASSLCNRYPGRVVPLVGSVCVTAAYVLSAFAPSIEVLYITIGVIAAIGMTFIVVPSISQLALWFDKKRGRAVAFAYSGCGIGVMALAPLMELLLSTYGYTGCMLIIAGFIFNSCVGVSLIRPAPLKKRRKLNLPYKTKNTSIAQKRYLFNTEPKLHQRLVPSTLVSSSHSLVLFKYETKPVQHGFQKLNLMIDKEGIRHSDIFLKSSATMKNEHQTYCLPEKLVTRSLPCLVSNNKVDKCDSVPCGGDSSSSGDKLLSRSGWPSWSCIIRFTGLDLLACGDFTMFCVFAVGYYACYNAFFTLMSGYCEENNLTDAQIAYLLSISNIISIFVTILSGVLLDAPFLKRHNFSYLFVIVCLTTLSMLVTPLTRNLPSIYLVSTTSLCLLGCIYSINLSLIPHLVPPERVVQAVGLNRCFLGLGGFIGPAAGATFADLTGSYATFYYFGGALLFASGLLFQLQICCKCFCVQNKTRYSFSK